MQKVKKEYTCAYCNETFNEIYQIGISDWCINCLNASDRVGVNDVDVLWHGMLGPITLNNDGCILIVEEE
jgi:hypothetical protein